MNNVKVELIAGYSIDIPNEDIQEMVLSKRYGIWTPLEIARELAKLKICNGKATPAWVDVKEK